VRRGSKASVFVRDNGKGIAGEHQERVFRMFEQLNPGEDPTGTGAGLALCKKIVEGNGEKIWLDSDPGVGTAVGFTVPVYKGESKVEDFIGQLSTSLELLSDSQKSRSSVIDEETELYDCNYFDEVLADRLRKYCEEGKKLGFLVVGISNYQRNKNEPGDDRLARPRSQLAARLKGSVRQSDLILRLSGERFLLILPETPEEIERIKDRVSTRWNDDSKSMDQSLELIFGAVSLDPSDHCDPAKALRRAKEGLNK